MTKTSVTGYPRVGSERELKFWTEDYFKGNISADMLQKNAAQLRREQWLLQQEQGVDKIPSNDFSFYDSVLDTAYLLGAVSQEYQNLNFDELDTCFAMARGYQGKKGDVKALSMRKWFNTNYHYMVPLLDDETRLRLNGTKPFALYTEALDAGMRTTPVLLGPFTFLKLSHYKNKKPQEFVAEIAAAYKDILDRFSMLGCDWLQLDEPSLVMDLTKEDISLFVSLYRHINGAKGDLKLLLQTYFGDIRDIYLEVINLGFDGIGIDFVEGKQSLALIEKHGFPKETDLFAGIINGKNIWRNDYEKSLKLLNHLTKYTDKERIVISTSCSLLHVPYTINSETEMDENHKRHFAFAHEKLRELNELQRLLDADDPYKDHAYMENSALMSDNLRCADTYIREKISALTESDFVRKPEFKQRETLQKEGLELPALPTTTIGSFPQTGEVKAWRTALKKGEITAEQYKQHIRRKTAECIALQQEIGLDVLVHGEYERSDMVGYFGENLDGFLFTQKAWVQSYGTRCVKPPIIWSDIQRSTPITVDMIAYAQSQTKKPVKGMLTGPVTILNWSFPREDISRKETAFQIALSIREEVMALEEAGIRIIQIDEAALKEKLPLRRSDWHTDYLSWAIPAFRLVHSGVKPSTQIHTHMCYSEFEDITEDIEAMDADVISFEAARSNLSIVDALKRADFKTQVGPGVYDIHSPRVPSKSEIEKAIKKMLRKIDKQKLWINPDCGLKTRGETETKKSLQNMVKAAQSVRETLK